MDVQFENNEAAIIIVVSIIKDIGLSRWQTTIVVVVF